jgi:hypothetical protein
LYVCHPLWRFISWLSDITWDLQSRQDMPRPGVLTFELPEEFSDEVLIGKEHLEDNYHRKMVKTMKPHFFF